MSEEFRMEYIKMVPVPGQKICRVTYEFDMAYELQWLEMFKTTHGNGQIHAVRRDVE